MPNSDIAVVIPLYNASTTILRALAGVFNQTLLPKEVVVVNDGSLDNSVAVIKGSEYKNLVKIISIENSGPANARNVGIKATNSRWIAFLDADDQWISKDKLKNQLRLAESDGDIVLVDSFAKVYWGESKILDITRVKQGNVFEQFLYENVVNATSSVFVKRESIVEAGFFDPDIKFGEDRLLWALVARQGSLATLKEFSVYKENHAANLTSKGEENYQYRKMLLLKLMPLIELSNKAKAQVILANYECFLMLGYRNRDGKLYRKFARMAYADTGTTFIFSKFSILYALSCIFWLLPKR